MNLDINTTSFQKVSTIEVPDIFNRRLKSGIDKIDTMLGGGFLPGSSFTLCAPAGCGKTTLMLQTLDSMASAGTKVAYASGEESVFQLAHTCSRLKVRNVDIANETDVEKLCDVMKDYDILIVDSFQALTTNQARGFRAVEKHAVQKLVMAAKEHECVLGMIMHLTKSGELKGSTIVPHTVDMNLKVSPMPDTDDETARLIYIDGKNRFGPLGDFEATLGYGGYNFNASVNRIEKEDKTAEPKVNRKQQELSELVRHDELSIRKACELLECAPLRAQHLLRELTMSELYVKTGRGPDSRWHKATEKVVQFAS
jgi:archaellum biogenesis ATPase FlaH